MSCADLSARRKVVLDVLWPNSTSSWRCVLFPIVMLYFLSWNPLCPQVTRRVWLSRLQCIVTFLERLISRLSSTRVNTVMVGKSETRNKFDNISYDIIANVLKNNFWFLKSEYFLWYHSKCLQLCNEISDSNNNWNDTSKVGSLNVGFLWLCMPVAFVAVCDFVIFECSTGWLFPKSYTRPQHHNIDVSVLSAQILLMTWVITVQ
jgi:hypothetical protein